MTMGVRFLSVMLMAAMLPLFMTGCKKSGAFPNCKNDGDCRVDATGAEINGVCYNGKCEECVEDTDCSDLKKCVRNRCLSACLEDADCSANNHCEDKFCVSDCSSDESCLAGEVCSQGRCVAQVDAKDPNAWATSECKGLQTVHFDFDKYDVKDEYRDHVARVATCLEKNAGYTIVILGHTDDRGTPSYNMALGQKRADAVRTYLKSNWGIAQNRIKTISHGEQQPLVSESNEYAWQQNRRAAFVIER